MAVENDAQWNEVVQKVAKLLADEGFIGVDLVAVNSIGNTLRAWAFAVVPSPSLDTDLEEARALIFKVGSQMALQSDKALSDAVQRASAEFTERKAKGPEKVEEKTEEVAETA